MRCRPTVEKCCRLWEKSPSTTRTSLHLVLSKRSFRNKVIFLVRFSSIIYASLHLCYVLNKGRAPTQRTSSQCLCRVYSSLKAFYPQHWELNSHNFQLFFSAHVISLFTTNSESKNLSLALPHAYRSTNSQEEDAGFFISLGMLFSER